MCVVPINVVCQGFNGAETNCRIAHILGILLVNSCNTDIFFGNYYHLQSVRFEAYFICMKYHASLYKYFVMCGTMKRSESLRSLFLSDV